MLIKTVDTVITTNSAGQTVESLPVREVVDGETDIVGRPVTVIPVTEDANGVPVRFVTGKSALNSAGQLVDTTPVKGGAYGPFAEVQRRFLAAASGADTGVKYIVCGDSTRDNAYNKMIAYYGHQLAKIGVTVVDNAASGQSGQDWASGAVPPTLAQAIAATPGTGQSTILEYSFGINDDKNGATRAQVKAWLKDGIVGYRTAKPDASVVLVSPVYTSNTVRNVNLLGIYQEIADELSLPLINLTAPMAPPIHGDTGYYQDATHPNINGSIRAVNIILDVLTPPSLYHVVTLDAVFLSNPPPSSAELAQPVESGYWLTATGLPEASSGWRRMREVAVEPNFVLRIQHQGNRVDVKFLDASSVFISSLNTTAVDGQLYRRVTIPAGARKARINISSEAAAYDALGDVPSVKYEVPEVASLTMAQINSGLNIRLLDTTA